MIADHPSWSRHGAWLLVLVLLAACGGGDTEAGSPLASASATTALASATEAPSSEASSAPPSDTPPPVPPTDPPTEAPPPPPVVSALQRRDAPPGGVAAQFDFFGESGSTPCESFDTSTPAVLVEGSVAEVASMYHVCVLGLADDLPIDVAITLPDGSVRTYPGLQSQGGLADLALLLLPGEPLGTYNVTATQGTTQLFGAFEAVRASFPRVVEIPPTEGPPGTTFRLAFGGFAPGAEIVLDLFGTTQPPAYVYLTTLPSAFTDGAGEAIYELPTAAGDPPGPYCVVYRLPGGQREFCDATFTVTP